MEQHREVRLKLEDRGSNELFAACPIQAYPGPAIGMYYVPVSRTIVRYYVGTYFRVSSRRMQGRMIRL